MCRQEWQCSLLKNGRSKCVFSPRLHLFPEQIVDAISALPDQPHLVGEDGQVAHEASVHPGPAWGEERSVLSLSAIRKGYSGAVTTIRDHSGVKRKSTISIILINCVNFKIDQSYCLFMIFYRYNFIPRKYGTVDTFFS